MDGNGGGSGGGGGGVAMAASAKLNLNGNAPPPFLSKTYEMVDDPATDAIVSWGPANNSFVVWNTPEFARDLLPKYFKHSNFSSFVRQLNTYGFRKVDPDRWEFANEGFLRGRKDLLKTINRRKPSHMHGQTQQPQPQNASVAACVEVGKFGLEEEIERLKRDKNVLMQELVRLRQQQQSTSHQLQTLGKRLKGMERRQQQMMSFLAKAMQSPGFLAQLVQQTDNNRLIARGNKKRRMPKQEGSLSGDSASPDGQIIKYQPLTNEAAKTMLRQILKAGSSQPRLESFSNSDNLSLENFPSSSGAFDCSSSSQNSGVTLAEVPPNSGVPYVPSSSGFSAVGLSSAVSEIQSSAGVTDMVSNDELPGMDVLSAVPEAIAATDESIPELEGVMPDDSVAILSENFAMPDPETVYIDPITAGMDGAAVPIETEQVSADANIDILDDDPELSGIIDSFWEEFFSSPVTEETEEAELSILEAMEDRPRPENGWDNSQNMEHLTEQMVLLSPDPK
ncbi:heat stress transcription factor A-1-like [Phoenix dactylifera]|uniref:Heat stress transcription factor A-1-like n=1 Tax=Phoenix dactylifera TaxID=42345 RepID=A0A8B7BHL9_PHODC|nr:heat stress transcription factor A-1-like [Phoenix dactylifera]